MSDAINRKRMNIYRSATRLPVAVSGNHCQTVHIRVSIGCVSIFFSVTRSMPPLGNVSLVKSRSEIVLLLGSVEILNIMEREEGKTTWRRVNR